MPGPGFLVSTPETARAWPERKPEELKSVEQALALVARTPGLTAALEALVVVGKLVALVGMLL